MGEKFFQVKGKGDKTGKFLTLLGMLRAIRPSIERDGKVKQKRIAARW
jgi:hypothetical protein